MTDARLRELQRRFEASGAVADEAPFLQARVRAGTLDVHDLELAADLGHPAARRALELEPLQAGQLAAHANLIRQCWGQWQLVRLSLALARAALPHEEPPLSAVHLLVRELLDAVAAWVENTQRSRAVWEQHRRVDPAELVAWAGEHVAGLVRAAALTVIRPPMQGSPSTYACEAMELGAELWGVEGMVAVLSREVVPSILNRPTES